MIIKRSLSPGRGGFSGWGDPKDGVLGAPSAQRAPSAGSPGSPLTANESRAATGVNSLVARDGTPKIVIVRRASNIR